MGAPFPPSAGRRQLGKFLGDLTNSQKLGAHAFLSCRTVAATSPVKLPPIHWPRSPRPPKFSGCLKLMLYNSCPVEASVTIPFPRAEMSAAWPPRTPGCCPEWGT